MMTTNKKLSKMDEAILLGDVEQFAKLWVTQVKTTRTRLTMMLSLNNIPPRMETEWKKAKAEHDQMIAEIGITDLANTAQSRAQFIAFQKKLEYDDHVTAYADHREALASIAISIATFDKMLADIPESNDLYAEVTEARRKALEVQAESEAAMKEIEEFLLGHLS